MKNEELQELCDIYLDDAQMKLKEAQMFDDVITEPFKNRVLFYQAVSQMIKNNNELESPSSSGINENID